ncbi:OmpA family protein [Shewanella intestini]|uniref:OmpA family protein n=1 Tax=Shewanella intestini TaxID=2017544 RepID=A0ABS5I053_9GAMM|nr:MULTISPECIES: OmpA family protein [Shewanella]MBR9726680.1 OmpA family protein [Shewanella intestini]
MKTNLLKVALLTSFLPFAAHSAEKLSPWYIGAGLGVNNYEPNCDQKTMKECGEDSPYAWDVFGGYMFGDYFGAELGYRDLGLADWVDYNNKPNDVGARGLTLGLVAQVPFAERWIATAEAGAMNYLLRNKKNYNSEYYSDSGIAPYIGVGLGYLITDNLTLQAQYRRYENLDDDKYSTLEMESNYWGIELSYRFGQKAKPAPVVAAAPIVVAPLDSDKDGVLDKDDKCANTPITHKVDANGCSIYEQTTEDRQLAGILFDNNSSVIKPSSYADIENLADYLKSNPGHTVLIEGHASNVGSPAYNMTLSDKRANAVAQALSEKYGIDANLVQAKGFGVTRPVMEGSSAEANRLNRRIEAIVTSIDKRPVLK